ncbi:MAG TPA: hypothetical protein VE871_05450 [Longimicrobium sp.]|nr:hypothetical protein [Longimicrobium sp.]
MARGVGGKLVLLVVLLVIGGGLWFFRSLIPGPWQRPDPVITEVSEAGAVAADAKLKRLREDGETVRMNGAEFTSYMRYRMAPRFSADIELPTVAFTGDQVQVAGRLPKDRIPPAQLRQLGSAASFIPDTATVVVGGGLRMLAPGRAALKVTSVSAERFPIPRDRYLPVLDRVGGMDEPGLERDEVAFQLPPGVGSARVENGELVLAPAEGR